jgi:hypothetical protein
LRTFYFFSLSSVFDFVAVLEEDEEDIILSQRAGADTGKRNSSLPAPKYFNTFGKRASILYRFKLPYS